MKPIIAESERQGTFVGRLWRPDLRGPSVFTLRGDTVIDITSRQTPTVRDVCEMDDPAAYVSGADGVELGKLDDIADANSGDPMSLHLLAPCDLQAIKACGVTFAQSMVERVIEEKAAGDPKRAREVRDRVGAIIGGSLRDLRAGSKEAEAVKQALIGEGLWSQYLEVGIGPDPEVFSKAQILSAVGYGALIGLHPASTWNNPEPEVVLAVASSGKIVGATLGNDVNLRDFEGRSALLLSQAKDNNASAAIGPLIRLFDDTYSLDDVRRAHLDLTVTGLDDFVLSGHSSMAEISRDPEDLVARTIGPHHQYPDGLVLYLGTLFAPTQDRDVPGEGFTHKIGDVVEVHSERLGNLRNTVAYATDCPHWRFGVSALMHNLADRDLI
jgi:fumarylacetoacetate (FAA) hydrolase family protein